MTPPAPPRAVSARLPDFPWDSLADHRRTAQTHPDGIVDLSVGTPIDPTPSVVRHALAAATDSPGYPATIGTPALREAYVGWLARRFDVQGVDATDVLATIGSKELISSLALHLGLGPGDAVVIPQIAYPTYEVGARLAGCDVIVSDSTTALGPQAPALLWLNSPANPTGRVLPTAHLAKVVAWARERGTLVVCDECYLESSWEGGRPVSVLHDSVNGGSLEGVLAVHSLSKRSNIAGYRAGFVAGDPQVVTELLAVRKNLGLMMPGPQQAACVAALDDDLHVDEQRALYARRRAMLREALEGAGFRIEHSAGSLYLWVTRDEPCRDTVAWFAERGILVAPGDFYGAAGAQHVRITFTATDERLAAGCARLA